METMIYGPFITRQQAQAEGLKNYFTGQTCCNGHVSPYSVSAWTCVTCQQNRGKKRAIFKKNTVVVRIFLEILTTITLRSN